MTSPAPPTPDPGREALLRGPSGPRRGGRRRRGGRGIVVAFLLANALPAAAAVWFFTRPETERRRLLDAIPAGVGTRVGAAALAFGLLLVLALVVLPGAKLALDGLRGLRGWVRSRRGVLRWLLFPVEALAGLLWFLVQCLFAVDAVAILATGAAFLMYVARIAKPDLFPFLPG